MSYETVLLPKWLSYQGRILAKEQFHNSYTFWAMSILIFSPVQIIMRHSILGTRIGKQVLTPFFSFRVWLCSICFHGHNLWNPRSRQNNCCKRVWWDFTECFVVRKRSNESNIFSNKWPKVQTKFNIWFGKFKRGNFTNKLYTKPSSGVHQIKNKMWTN